MELIGETFGRLKVISQLPAEKQQRIWKCLCSCGAYTAVPTAKLLSGHTKSCGCLRREVQGDKNPAYKHGHTFGDKFSPEYHTWSSVVQRCTNTTRAAWKYYGGRGITVCERWLKFENFLEDMGERPPGTSLDRTDVDGNYEASNCRWATAAVQARNRKPLHITDGHRQDILSLIMAGHEPLPELYELLSKLHDEVVKKEVRKLRAAGLIATARVKGYRNGVTLSCQFCGK